MRARGRWRQVLHHVVVGFVVGLDEEEGVVIRAELQFGQSLLMEACEGVLGEVL